MKAKDITQQLRAVETYIVREDAEIEHLLTDSRKISDEAHSLFFAIPTKHNTGCRYIDDLYRRGVRNFVVPIDTDESYRTQFQRCGEANFWYVKNVVLALQQVAASRRRQFQIPMVGITGSNG